MGEGKTIFVKPENLDTDEARRVFVDLLLGQKPEPTPKPPVSPRFSSVVDVPDELPGGLREGVEPVSADPVEVDHRVTRMLWRERLMSRFEDRV